MAVTNKIFINFPGGIISPGQLLDVMEIASAARIAEVRFTSRQQLLIDVAEKDAPEFLGRCAAKNIRAVTTADRSENIVSSYAAESIFITEGWLSEGVYKDVFDLFDYEPSLKVNLCDRGQTFTPFFTGNINWIASGHVHFWHLYIRFPKTNTLYEWPELIYTNDIVPLSKIIERQILASRERFYGNPSADGNALHQEIVAALHYLRKTPESKLVLPKFQLPYYEGFNRSGNSYWLGIYRRDEWFSVAFLKDLCKVCLETRVGEIYATTWKSIIIKGIEHDHRELWDVVLGRYRINVRHAANELNWLVEDDNEDGLVLKRHVIRHFDKEDVRTYGLCFSVRTKSRTGIFGSVIIRRKNMAGPNRLKSIERYNIYYTNGFNPNSSDLILYRENVQKTELGVYLVSLCKQFYDASSNASAARHPVKVAEVVTESAPPSVYQCTHCLTVYDAATGEPEKGIVAGTSFDDLDEDYCCPLCEAPKSAFVETVSPHHLTVF